MTFHSKTVLTSVVLVTVMSAMQTKAQFNMNVFNYNYNHNMCHIVKL